MRDDTLLTHAGRTPAHERGAINPPVYRASTIAFESVAELEAAHKEPFARGALVYGRYGTPTTFALEDAIAALEGGHRAIAVSSGLAAVAAALGALTAAGDHVLVADSVYGPTRRLCDTTLKDAGVSVTYYDPLIGAAIAELIQPNTRVIYLESPGSLTFEVQDVPAIAAVARERGIRTILDNTWATPFLFKAFEHGVDATVHSATKYIGGHSDLLLGLIVTNEETYARVRLHTATMGYSWGGYESLALLIDPSPIRTAKPWEQSAPMLRLHVGLEDPEDLIADLEASLAAFT